MGKSVHDDVLDQALNYIKNNVGKEVFCSAQPGTYNEANVTFALASKTLTSGNFTGPQDGDVSGRKVTINAEPSVAVTASGTGTHVALLDTVNLKLLYVTTSTSQAVLLGGLVDLPAWDIEISDPS